MHGARHRASPNVASISTHWCGSSTTRTGFALAIVNSCVAWSSCTVVIAGVVAANVYRPSKTSEDDH